MVNLSILATCLPESDGFDVTLPTLVHQPRHCASSQRLTSS